MLWLWIAAAWAEPDVELISAPELPHDDPVDFLPGDVEILVGPSLEGTGPGPLSALGAFVGWWGVRGRLDAGIARVGDLSIGLGGELAPAIAPVPLAAANAAERRERDTFDRAGAWHADAAARATVHWTGPLDVDPYGLLLGGGFVYRLDADDVCVGCTDALGEPAYVAPGARLGAGAGITGHTRTKLVFSAELRYVAALRLLAPQAPGEAAFIDEHPTVRQPRGFSWVVQVGYRI